MSEKETWTEVCHQIFAVEMYKPCEIYRIYEMFMEKHVLVKKNIYK